MRRQQTTVGRRARMSSSKASQADAAAVGNHESSVTQSGVEVVQDPELSKDDRPLWVAVEAFDLAVFEYEHVTARGIVFVTHNVHHAYLIGDTFEILKRRSVSATFERAALS